MGINHSLRSLILVAGMLSLLPFGLRAAALGDITVESVLNEPFFGRIELVGADSRTANWAFEIGGPELYSQLQVDRPSYAEELTVTLVQPYQRAPEIHVAGRTPLRDLILDLVLVVRSDGTQRVRHYPVLIDFPAVDAPSAAIRPRPAPEPARPEPRQPAATLDVEPGGGTYRVASGDSLSAIAKRLSAGTGMNLNDVMDAIFQLNPDAFIRGDMNLIRAGAVLQLPALDGSTMEVAEMAPEPATDRMSSAGGTPVQTPAPESVPAASAGDPRLELKGSPDTETIVENLNTWLEADDEETARRVGEVRRDLAFAAAEIETYRRENDVLKSRIQSLEERVVEMERLLTLQTSLIASMDEGADDVQAAQSAVAAARGPDVEPAGTEPARIPDGPTNAAGAEAEDVVAVDDGGEESLDSRWFLFPGLAAVLLIGFGIFVFLRSMREDMQRRSRTEELTRRLRDTAERERAVLPEDL